jgi:anti-sigma factor RsiW
MRCAECRTVMHAYIDDELDIPTSALVVEHIADCKECDGAYAQALALRTGIRSHATRFDVPAALASRVHAAIAGQSHDHRQRLKWWTWLNAGASFACAAVLAYSLVLYQAAPSRTERLAEEIANSHTRSLMVDHLTDVASSDQHTVKPWFTGKLPYSPPVVDLAQQDFALIGARLDYIGAQAVAALVYKRRGHLVNLYVWPDTGSKAEAGESSTDRGYQQVRWLGAGMRFWAISDINARELQEFQALLAARVEGGA